MGQMSTQALLCLVVVKELKQDIEYYNQERDSREACNKILCLHHHDKTSDIYQSLFPFSSFQLLWHRKPNRLRLSMFYMLVICPVIIILLLLSWWVVDQFCSTLHDGCSIFLLPPLCMMILMAVYLSTSSFLASVLYHRLFFEIENNMGVLVTRQVKGTSFQLDTSLKSKEYSSDLECPISLLAIKWKQIQTCIQIAIFTLPEDETLHLPVICDAIDIIRPPLIEPSRFTSNTSFQHYEGVLIIHHSRKKEEPLLTFLAKSGFSVLCNARQLGIIISMKQMPRGGTWIPIHIVLESDYVALDLEKPC